MNEVLFTMIGNIENINIEVPNDIVTLYPIF